MYEILTSAVISVVLDIRKTILFAAAALILISKLCWIEPDCAGLNRFLDCKLVLLLFVVLVTSLLFSVSFILMYFSLLSKQTFSRFDDLRLNTSVGVFFVYVLWLGE